MMVNEISRPLYNEIGITRDVFNLSYKNGTDSYWKLDKSSDIGIYPEFGNSLNSINSYEISSNRILEGVIANVVNINFHGNEESMALKKRILKILELLKSELNK